ncbi:hypothetical protein [Actibacterium lipolyticum]|nr:hypothetical protein [Actibacterium lipolyticum]
MTLMLMSFSAVAAEDTRFHGATGGILRFPNSNQPEDENNLFGEAWLKLAYSVAKTEKGNLSFYTLGNVVADTKPFAYNNTAKLGVGLSYSYQVSDALNISFSARHDWFQERTTDVRRSAMKYEMTYYYYRYWAAEPDDKMFGLSRNAWIFKSYGTLAYPGSLEENDDNLVLTLGGEYSTDLQLGESKWLLSPFIDVDFAWDRDGNNYNNKIIPGVGAKIRRPIEKGEIFVSLRAQADYRWKAGTTDVKPGIHIGWYKGF